MIRVGKVVQVFPATGKVKVLYGEEGNTSVQLPMITMNSEYRMPNVGDKVLTLHMDNGLTKGFVLGTYYGSTTPAASAGYRKDFGGNAYVTSNGGAYTLKANTIAFQCAAGNTSVASLLQRIEALEEKVQTLEGKVETLETTAADHERRISALE